MKLKCKSETLRGTAGAQAVAFECSDLLLATPALDRAIYWAPKDAGEGGGYFTKTVGSGRDGDRVWLDICTDYLSDNGVDHRDASRLYVDGTKVQEAQAHGRAARRCGVKRPASPPADRWQGGVR